MRCLRTRLLSVIALGAVNARPRRLPGRCPERHLEGVADVGLTWSDDHGLVRPHLAPSRAVSAAHLSRESCSVNNPPPISTRDFPVPSSGAWSGSMTVGDKATPGPATIGGDCFASPQSEGSLLHYQAIVFTVTANSLDHDVLVCDDADIAHLGIVVEQYVAGGARRRRGRPAAGRGCVLAAPTKGAPILTERLPSRCRVVWHRSERPPMDWRSRECTRNEKPRGPRSRPSRTTVVT